jgi:hypothetical protein
MGLGLTPRKGEILLPQCLKISAVRFFFALVE